MTAGQIRRSAIALAALGVGSFASAADPSIPLRVSLTIPETCTIGPGVPPAVDAEMPSVNCAHGTPFVLSHAPLPDVRSAPRSIGAGVLPTWTVTF
ncbi:hypothetical protein BLA6993_07783 [Burkholderia lata]|uniref:hypothetical protein n=1 Tax=Burkholderia lata (strain ATCC 17760 / DSM 23089 / LMG 22485 / NCIMB 9086 / R18194 / 383) TaxID=482957 RepID=UPI00145471E6|nr:hypothetical protein [Burkholderia lata]VWC49650.1 hypothetical protein BLA6993_07783 [Burkholderia lata]